MFHEGAKPPFMVVRGSVYFYGCWFMVPVCCHRLRSFFSSSRCAFWSLIGYLLCISTIEYSSTSVKHNSSDGIPLTPRFPQFRSSAFLQLVCETFCLILQDIDKQVRSQAEHGRNDNAKCVAVQIVDSSKPQL